MTNIEYRELERIREGIAWLIGWHSRTGAVPIAPLRALAGIGGPVKCTVCGGTLDWVSGAESHYGWSWVCTDEPDPLSRPVHEHVPTNPTRGRTDR